MNNDYLPKTANPNGAGIVLIHEWWGVNGQIKKMADKIAGEGFMVLAVDLYEGKVAGNAEEASQMKDGVTDEHAFTKMRGAILELEKYGIPSEKIAIWGFCFGGSFAFKAAVENLGAGAYVVFYGSKITDQKEVLARIQKPILGIFGGKDKSIPVTKAETMKNTLTSLGKPNEVYIYPDADHAFMNEERQFYNAEAAKDAWEKTMAFLTKYL